MSLDPSLARYNQLNTQLFFERLGREARATAGVKSATLASAAPVFFPDNSWIVPEGFRFQLGRHAATVFSCATDQYYFQTLRISISIFLIASIPRPR